MHKNPQSNSDTHKPLKLIFAGISRCVSLLASSRYKNDTCFYFSRHKSTNQRDIQSCTCKKSSRRPSQFNESHPRLYWSGGSEKEVRYESYQAWRRRKQLIIRQVRVKVENLSATRPLQINRAKSITETNEQLSKKKKKERRGGHSSIKTGFRRKSNYSACFHGGGPWRNDWPTGWLITRNRRTIVERWRFISVPIWRVSKPVYDIGVSFFFFFFDTHLPATINIPFPQTKGYRGLVRFQKSNLFTESARSVSHKMVMISDEYDDA